MDKSSSVRCKLKKLNLSIIPKPKAIPSYKTFNDIQAFPILTEKIAHIINELKTHDRQSHFFKSVPGPLYKKIISRPIHFGQILTKLRAPYAGYITLGDIQSDIDLLWQNCWKFNGYPIVGNSMFGFSNFASDLEWVLAQYLECFKNELIAKHYLLSHAQTYTSLDLKIKHHSSLDLDVSSKPNCMNTVDSFEKVRAFPFLLDKIADIIKQIKLWDIQESFFREVTVLSYKKVIDSPIHFGEILQRIKDREYVTMGDVKSDIDLLWSNCYRFNGKPTIKQNVFSRFAYDLQTKFDGHLKGYIQILKCKGYIQSLCGKKTHRELREIKNVF